MQHKLSNNARNLLSVLGANFFVMFVGIIQSFLFPKLMGPNQYGYWSMYLLYIGYAGFFNLGVSDGIYLLFGGENYNDLEKGKFKAYFNIILFYLSVFLIIWVLYCFFSQQVTQQLLIMLAIGLSSFLACLINYVVMIDQATSRFNIYSKGHIIEKIAIMAGTIILIKLRNPLVVIMASIIGRMITVFYYYANSKPILYAKHSPYKEALKDMATFFSAGIWMTLAAIGTTAMTGIGRFFIHYQLGVTELGYFSFVLSISGLFTIFFSAIATVLFPMLKRSTGEAYRKQMIILDNLLDWVGILILLLYFPAKSMLSILYPQYESALKILVVLFPLVLLQGRTSMVYYTIYKVERLERQYVYNLIIALLVCVIFSMSSLMVVKDITSVAVATYGAFVVWCIVIVALYNKNSDIKLKYHFGNLLLSVIFLTINLVGLPNGLDVIVTYCVYIPIAIYSTIKAIPDIKHLRYYL
ncbi:oligosaccharide flippase family protein [Proteiniclasticum sp. SCR006]|uniref:Oligosaccharide flippase family protein n=1 Tax=Proteiniclasticum aestuarii TaxID=2817862 RepID=A0A939HB45_9CLOT|nr:oligosaccharide flippase family protein [Proteiniclasticum aestuarii]MBO1265075.1 oligosaccharide flippase family protein [Proteiniclasticum aestuarii]